MRVYVMRHGPAEDYAATGRDEDRALTTSGRDRVRSVAALLLEEDEVPTRILTSTLVRAVQTADIVQTVLHAGGKETSRSKQKELCPGGATHDLVRNIHPDHPRPGVIAAASAVRMAQRREELERALKDASEEQRARLTRLRGLDPWSGDPVMLVGHEPDLSTLVETILQASMPVPMDKAMVVALETEADGTGALRFIVEPRTPTIVHDHRR